MALKVFDKKNSFKRTPTQWLLNVNRNTGRFYLNNLIADELKLTNNLRGVVAYDEDAREWMLAFGENVPGFRLIVLSNNGCRTRLNFGCRKAAHAILNYIKATTTASFVVSKRPRAIDGQKWYRIMTKNPMRIN